MSREGRKKVPVDELLQQWEETLEENQRIMAPLIGRVAVKPEGWDCT